MKRGPTRESCVSAIQPFLISQDRKHVIPGSAYQPGQGKRNTIRINVNGRVFELSRSTCIRIPVLQGMLTRFGGALLPERKGTVKRSSSISYPKEELYFERNPTVFAAVVDYVQNNELHVPPHVCAKLFARDLSFWGFDIDEVEPCCFSGVVHFLWEQEKLSKFHSFLDHTNPYLQAGKGRKVTVIQTFRARVWRVLDEPFTSVPARIYFYVMCLFILMSFFTIAASTMEKLDIKENEHHLDGVVHKLGLAIPYLGYLCNAYLYLDYLLRFLFFPETCRFFCDLINITDGLAVVSSIAKTTLEELPIATDHSKTLDAVNILQLLKILRLLRPMSKVTGFRLIYFTLKCSFHELLLVFSLLGFLTIFFASTLYYLGDKASIPSIPHGMWFALTTMTTVGYGDIVPHKALTKLIGSVVAVFGIIFMSMTMPIMVSNFNSLYINAVVGQPAAIEKAHEQLGQTSQAASNTSFQDELEEQQAEEKGETSDVEGRACFQGCKNWCARVSRACKAVCTLSRRSSCVQEAESLSPGGEEEEKAKSLSGDEADDESDSGRASGHDVEEYFTQRWTGGRKKPVRVHKISTGRRPSFPTREPSGHDLAQATQATRRLLMSRVGEPEEMAPHRNIDGVIGRRRFAVVSDGMPLLPNRHPALGDTDSEPPNED